MNAGYLAEGAPDAYPASQTKVGLGTAAMVACANYVTSEVDAAVGEPVNWGFFNYPEVEAMLMLLLTPVQTLWPSPLPARTRRLHLTSL